MTDREILAALRRSDHAAFDVLFRAHYAALVAVAARILRSRANAEEVVQDVFLELWRRRDSIEVRESLRSYLFRSARNRALNHLRHERVERRAASDVEFFPSAAPPAALSLLTQEEIDEALRDAVASLPARCREVFELSRVHGLRNAEVAEVLGISVKSVESQMTKALRVLRQRLAPWVAERRA